MPDDVNRPDPSGLVAGHDPLYRTGRGAMFVGDSSRLMAAMPAGCADLVVTSPPYALHFKKEYGNADQAEYVDWFLPFAEQVARLLSPSGSFVLNLGGSWEPGRPTRSLWVFRLLIRLCDELGYHLCQEFFWHNPAKLPAPAEWVNVRRVRVKDATEYVFWLARTPHPKANNAAVLNPYSKDMRRLIDRGIRATRRPSGHNIRETFAADRGGSIPDNVIRCGNNESNSAYVRETKRQGRRVHPARFPAELPRFFAEFLTEPGDLVVDPFAGSNTTGAVAERLGRRWLAFEQRPDYAEDSRLRFEDTPNRREEAADEPQLFAAR